MNWVNITIGMLPEELLLAGMLVLIALEVLKAAEDDALTTGLTTLVLAAGAAVWLALNQYSFAAFPGHFSVDADALLAKAIVLALAIPVMLISRDEVSQRQFHILVLASLYGVCLLLSADSFLILFIGIELMSLPVYALVLLAYSRPQSAEAALKYLILGGTATATLLMGVSLLCGTSGSFALSVFTDALRSQDAVATIGVVLVVVGFFLKAAIVPFHTWAPDAYEASAVPVTAFMATVVKAGVVLAAVRLFQSATVPPALVGILACLPLVSIVWGNLAAMRQQSFRRLIAYSSIAHAGYLFFALLGDPAGRFQSVTFYVLAYGSMNLLAFAALPRDSDDEARDRLDNLRGLFHRRPYAALMIAIAMLSLAGIPPLPGFVAKFLIFRNVMAAGFTTYAVLGLVGSYLGIYLYLRVIQCLFMTPDAASASARPSGRLAFGASLLCVVAAGVLSILPGWVMSGL